MVHTFEIEKQLIHESDPWSGILSAVAWAVHFKYHTTLQSTPGQLLFGQDAIWDTSHVADWQYIKQCKQILINKNNENEKRIDYDYAVGESIMKIKAGSVITLLCSIDVSSKWSPKSYSICFKASSRADKDTHLHHRCKSLMIAAVEEGWHHKQ
jgi:hypothetical protein